MVPYALQTVTIAFNTFWEFHSQRRAVQYGGAALLPLVSSVSTWYQSTSPCIIVLFICQQSYV